MIGCPHASYTQIPAFFPFILWSCYKSVIWSNTNEQRSGRLARFFFTSVGLFGLNILSFIDYVRNSLVFTRLVLLILTMVYLILFYISCNIIQITNCLNCIVTVLKVDPPHTKGNKHVQLIARYWHLFGDYSALDFNALALAFRQFLLDIADIISLRLLKFLLNWFYSMITLPLFIITLISNWYYAQWNRFFSRPRMIFPYVYCSDMYNFWFFHYKFMIPLFHYLWNLMFLEVQRYSNVITTYQCRQYWI